LTTQTIESHLTKLIQSRTIGIKDVLSEAKLQALSEAFKFYKEESINGLKEQYGDQFSWDELRMYKASLNI
jgi:hypothetical protein